MVACDFTMFHIFFRNIDLYLRKFISFEVEKRIGELAERSKAHAWKACIPQKGIKGSNPLLSAKYLKLN